MSEECNEVRCEFAQEVSRGERAFVLMPWPGATAVVGFLGLFDALLQAHAALAPGSQAQTFRPDTGRQATIQPSS